MLQSRNCSTANISFNDIHEKFILNFSAAPHALPFLLKKKNSKSAVSRFQNVFRLAVSIYCLKM